jgi:predicted ribosome quality control (RQC) complex YloA/Tae2 family protein
LLLSAHPQQGGVYLTTVSPDPTETTPMFCLLLRKHLEGFRIDQIFQKGSGTGDGLLECSGKDETGLLTKRWLIAEIMGKHSNLISDSSTMKALIIDSIRRVNHLISRVREILPGLSICLATAPRSSTASWHCQQMRDWWPAAKAPERK